MNKYISIFIILAVIIFATYKKFEKEPELQFPNARLSLKEQILENEKLLKVLKKESVLRDIEKLFYTFDILKNEKDFNAINNFIIRIEAIILKIEEKKIVEKLKKKKMYYEASLLNSLIKNANNIVILHYSIKDLNEIIE